MKKKALILLFGAQLFAVTSAFAQMPWPQCFPCTDKVAAKVQSAHSGNFGNRARSPEAKRSDARNGRVSKGATQHERTSERLADRLSSKSGATMPTAD